MPYLPKITLNSGKKIMLGVVILVMALAQFRGSVLAINSCPSGMSSLDCQAVTDDWTQWVPNVCGATGASAVTLTGTDNIMKAFNYFAGKNILTSIQIAGLLGNLYAESSGIVPTTTEDGKSDPTPIPGIGFGIAQWTTAGRQQGLVQLANSEGLPPTDLGVQLDYVWQELNNNYKTVLQALEADSDLPTATNTILMGYEIPEVLLTGTPAQIQAEEQARLSDATAILTLYSASAPASSTTASATLTTDTTGCGTGSGGSIAGCAFGSSTGPFTTNTTAVTTFPKEISVTQMCQNVQEVVYDRTSSVFKQWTTSCNAPGASKCAEGWCGLAVAIAWGYKASGYNSAANPDKSIRPPSNLVAAENAGVFHAGDMSPPVGALLFYSSISTDGHVAVYLGNNMVMSSDVWGPGVVGVNPVDNAGDDGYIWIAPESTMLDWTALHGVDTYLGWSEPIFDGSQYETAS